MKITVSAIILCLLYSSSTWAATITAIQDGLWTSTTTWDLARAPQDNDEVIIPVSRTVAFTGSPYPKNTPAVRPTLRIKIYGMLDFSAAGNDKLYLDAGSTIQIFAGGIIQTSTASGEIIAIYTGTDDNTVWTGTPATINGPAYATATTSGFSNGILPVHFESFTIKRDSKGFATLTWITSAQINVARFQVERSARGSVNWLLAGTVTATGSNFSEQRYNFSLPLFEGENRFRLKEIDNDGKFTFSNVVTVNFNDKTIEVFYDSNAHRLYVKNADNGLLKIHIFDAAGHSSYKGYASATINFQPPMAGVYFVNVVNGDSHFVKKITVY